MTAPIRVSVPPMSRAEMTGLGWDQCDVILVTGDAYVDHPSFGSAVIARVLIDAGFRTGIIAQPDWRTTQGFAALGKPRLFFGVTAGNVDSMVNHYSPSKQKRRADAYSPGGRTDLRPNRATIVYCNRLREVFPGTPLVLGGIEASLRRLAHYDYWEDKVRRSLLLDAKADIIAYGMAESQVVEIARRLDADVRDALDGIPGTVVCRKTVEGIADCLEIPAFEAVRDEKPKFLEAFMLWFRESDQPKGKTIAQKTGDRYVVQYPPPMPLTQAQLDHIYDLPFQRVPHPAYEKAGKIPALETVKFSITSHRGCLGSCTFCSLRAHQARVIQWRSAESVLREAQAISTLPGFKGHITDVGGPTANMYGATCSHLASAEPCRKRECLFPARCPSLKSDLRLQLHVMEQVRRLPGIKKVSIGTGLRYDLFVLPAGQADLDELSRYYISGQLRIAPEHVSDRVLSLMRKTAHHHYEHFVQAFREANQRLDRNQYLIPYFISGFPGCTLEDMVELAEYLADAGRHGDFPSVIRQVQDFTPLPMTLATAMYYTETDPFSGRHLHVAKDPHEKRLQRALLQLNDPRNRLYVSRALQQSGSRRLLDRLSRLLRPR